MDGWLYSFDLTASCSFWLPLFISLSLSLSTNEPIDLAQLAIPRISLPRSTCFLLAQLARAAPLTSLAATHVIGFTGTRVFPQRLSLRLKHLAALLSQFSASFSSAASLDITQLALSGAQSAHTYFASPAQFARATPLTSLAAAFSTGYTGTGVFVQLFLSPSTLLSFLACLSSAASLDIAQPAFPQLPRLARILRDYSVGSSTPSACSIPRNHSIDSSTAPLASLICPNPTCFTGSTPRLRHQLQALAGIADWVYHVALFFFILPVVSYSPLVARTIALMTNDPAFIALLLLI